MKVFLKYISKNMFEKKGRLCLLIFSIAMSTALLVASTGLIDIIFDSFTKPYEAALVSEIGISSATDDPFFDTADIDSDKLSNLNPELRVMGIINDDDKIRYVQLHGKESYDGKLKEGTNDFIESFSEGSETTCLLSERVANSLSLKNGDTIKLFISGQEVTFTIKAIAVNDGIFYADTGNTFHIVVPYEYLNNKMNADGKYSYIGADVKGNIKDFIKAFNNEHSELTAYELSSELESDTSITALLYSMMTIIVIVSSIIIHGVFKLIMTERLTVIGTFMSQGATKKKIERIILLEGLMYSIIGGIVGCALGETLLFVIGRLISPLAEYGIYTPFNINPMHIVIGMVFAAVLSIVSAYTPVRSIRKYEVKDVILNRTENVQKKKTIKIIAGIIFLGFSIIVAVFDGKHETPASVISILTAFAGVILLTPTIVKYLAGFLAKVFKNNTTVYLTMNNIKTSKLLRNNIVLVVVSLSAVLLISSFGVSMTDLVTGAYNDIKYDYSINNIMENGSDKATTDLILEKLNSTPGIDTTTIVTSGWNQAAMDGETIILSPSDGIAIGKMMNNYTPLIKEHEEELIAYDASTDNQVIITTKTAKAINKKKGDTVTIEYNSRKVDFTVAGIYDGKVWNNGIMALIKPEAAREIFNITEAGDINFCLDGTRSAEEVEADFKPYLSSLGATYTTKAEDCKNNNDSNAMVVKVMAVFSYLALIIASIGIFNNITISFHQRKKEFAVMSSVGMTTKRRKNMILTESIFSALISIIITIPFMVLLTTLFTGATYFIGIPMVTSLSWLTIPKFSAAVIVIIFIASLGAMKKSKKLSIVQELKYE